MRRMRLIDYMREHSLDDSGFAAVFNDGLPIDLQCSPFAVKKWKYGERQPSPERIVHIENVTGGKVCLRDWLAPAPSFAEPERRAS